MRGQHSSRNIHRETLTSPPGAAILFIKRQFRLGWACVRQNLSPPISELLARWKAGDEDFLRPLLPLFYNELRRVAHYQLRKERRDHTLQSTALVHEAYLRLSK